MGSEAPEGRASVLSHRWVVLSHFRRLLPTDSLHDRSIDDWDSAKAPTNLSQFFLLDLLQGQIHLVVF